jgi:transcriptional regulator of acetoin/glycerol metabolism
VGEIMMDEDTQFFELPGIHDEIESLNRQLDAAHDHLDHIVITGPTGVGKSQFVRIVKERLWNYKAEDAEFKTVDCESIAKEELEGWRSIDANGNELIILENLECFPVSPFTQNDGHFYQQVDGC